MSIQSIQIIFFGKKEFLMLILGCVVFKMIYSSNGKIIHEIINKQIAYLRLG